MKRFISATLLCVVVVGLTGCGAGGQRARLARDTVARSRGALAVTLGSFFMRPASVIMAAGKHDLLVTNESDGTHELVIVRTNTAANRLPVRGDRVDEPEAGVNKGEVDDLGPGQQRSLSLSLPPGRYVMFCNLPGHYHQGMHAEITVL